MWTTRASEGMASSSPPAPAPRKRGTSVGSSSANNYGGSNNSHYNPFTRHTKDRLSATEPPVLALSSMAIAPAPASTGSLGLDRNAQRMSLERVDAIRATRSSSDPLADDAYYTAQHKLGNYVKQGWLTKQGHMWKNWKTRFFVLYGDGTFAYYKSDSRRKMLGCLTLHDGIVSITQVDIRKIGKPYVFQIEKGFYKLLCYCCSQYEVELWVSLLHSVCGPSPLECEQDPVVTEEIKGMEAVRNQMNKFFVTDRDIAQSVDDFKAAVTGQRADEIQRFIAEIVEVVIERHILALLSHEDIARLPGNDLKNLIQQHVEDRVFIGLYSTAYESLETAHLRSARVRAARNTKLLYAKTQSDFGIPDDLSAVSSWRDVVEIVNRLDCVSLPSQKLDIVNTAATKILKTIKSAHGAMFDVPNDALAAVFRYVIVLSSLDDMCLLRALLGVFYKNHPACQNTARYIEAFLDAIEWIENYEGNDSAPQSNSMSLAAARTTVSISTREIGIQFTTDGNCRGAIVHSIRKLSQAALSETIVPGLSLIAINDEPVVLMPFREIVRRLRTAALPKRLTFMSEFYYYQVLSLDGEMFQYLMCLAAARGDKDSVTWLHASHVNMNELCSWGKARGKQVFGFKPPSGKSAPLFAAALHGQGVMVKYLLGLGADPNLLNRKGKSPLHVVGQCADMAVIIEALVSAGADIDAPDKRGLTPLMAMCARGSIEGAATLLALGADIHKVAWSSGLTALSSSVASRSLALVDLCLSKASDANVQSFDGDTSLHLAAANGDSEIILRLIEGGADPNIQNRYGQTAAAVVLATSSSQVSRDRVVLCLEILACAGGRLDKRDIFGRQALHLASHLADERTTRVVRKMSSLSFAAGSDDGDIDIYGCSAREYSECSLTDSDVSFLVSLKPQDAWKVADSDNRVLSARSYRLDELVHSLVHDVRVDFADVVSFVLFLESFSSLNEVVERLKTHTWSKERGRGLIRLFVLLLLFKERDVDESEYVRERFYSLMEHFTGVDRAKLEAKVQAHRDMFQQYLALRGNERCLELYTKISLAMEDMYNPYIHSFEEPFPAKMHRHTEASKWAEQCTLLTHALFTSIPVEDFIKTSKQSHSIQFLCAKRWFQHLSAYVVNAVLLQESSSERAEVVTFFLSAADYCLALHNYDSLAAILYALQSTAVQRLRRTIDQLSVASKKMLNDMQQLSDKGCREMNKSMRKAASPSMPYIGLYLQSFVGINELPAFDKPGLVNANRLRKMGELVVEILRRRSAPYALSFDDDIDKLLHVALPFDSEESRYARSLALEPREAGAAPLSDRSSLVTTDDLDIESEVRESIGSEGTFGIRQWLRKQKVVHRNRSRSSAQMAQHEWV